MAREYGFSGFPVVEQGELVGIVTGRDLRVKPNAGDTVAAIMTPKDKLVTAREGTPLEEMKAKFTRTASRRCWWSTRTSTCVAW